MYAAHEFHNDDLTDLLEKIKFFVSSKDDFNLRNLLINYQESEVIRSKYRQLNILLIKIHLQKLSDEKYYTTEDINLLTDYLFGVEFWGYYELLLFSNTLDVLNHETMIILAREMNDNVLIIDLEEFLDDILSYSIAGHCGPSHSCGGGR